MQDNKQTALSGIKPTGRLTLGNYIGALKNFPSFQEQYHPYRRRGGRADHRWFHGRICSPEKKRQDYEGRKHAGHDRTYDPSGNPSYHLGNAGTAYL